MGEPLRFEQGVRTDAGSVRTVNEDACLARGPDGLWAVADGMGGHIKGSWASTQIIDILTALKLPSDLDETIEAVRTALHRANSLILQTGYAEGNVIGSTVVALIIRDHHYAVLWAGDSRAYRIRKGALDLLTTDHSPVEEMVASGLLTRQEAQSHPMAHMLSRAVGARANLALDLCSGDVLPGDVFLLCSDGLTRTVHDKEIVMLMDQNTPRYAASALVDLALARDAADNVTVVTVECDETTRVAMAGPQPD
jgi:serine/threonine-protein phosphatase Stp1